jgi:hypothetical protein
MSQLHKYYIERTAVITTNTEKIYLPAEIIVMLVSELDLKLLD